jgi:hypothetical protein
VNGFENTDELTPSDIVLNNLGSGTSKRRVPDAAKDSSYPTSDAFSRNANIETLVCAVGAAVNAIQDVATETAEGGVPRHRIGSWVPVADLYPFVPATRATPASGTSPESSGGCDPRR